MTFSFAFEQAFGATDKNISESRGSIDSSKIKGTRIREEEQREREREMNQNMSALMIGLIGAAITLSAYSQTLMSPTECVTVGLIVLLFGLLIREGLIPL
ncbi:unnamed protein product [Camellia sinensis]